MRTYEQCILTAAKDTETDSTQVYTHTLIIVVPHLSVGAVPQQLQENKTIKVHHNKSIHVFPT